MSAGVILFLISVAVLLYVLGGYPALLALGTFSKMPAPRPEPNRKSVSILLAVRDGERWIRQKMESLLGLDYPRELLQILIISDGSTDNTDAIVEEFDDDVTLIRVPPAGKAVAINHGLARATGDLLFFTDVRQKLDANCLRVLASHFSDPSVGVATGELVIGSGLAGENAVGLYWRVEKWFRKRHAEIDSVLGATGAIYMIRRELAEPLPEDALLDDVQLPMNALLHGYRIVFVEEAKAYDVPTTVKAEFRRKVRTLAGVYQMIRDRPSLLGTRNRMWFHFVSHKVGRLLLPYCLLGILVASFLLPRPWRELVLIPQAGFYLVAALDPWVGEANPFKRISSMACTATTFMLAALIATSALFRPSRSFWK